MRRRVQQPGMMIGAYGLPGQREIIPVDERSDYRLVLKQWGALVVYLTFATLLTIANILIIGPWLGYSAGIIITLLFGLWLMAATQDKPIWHIGILVGLSIVVIWLFFGMRLIELMWWDVRCEWHPRNKALFVGYSALLLAATGLPIFRFAYETIDPRWPPTIGMRDAAWGILWPGKQIPSEYEPEIVREEVVREVPKPIPTYGSVTVSPEQPPDPARVERNGHKTVMAPSGRETKVSDLVTFIRLAPTLGTSYTSVWSGRGWEHDQWKDVVDIWTGYGVTDGRAERKTTRMLVTNFTEAMGRLSSAFD